MKRAFILLCVISVAWIDCGDRGIEPAEVISTPNKPVGPEWLLWEDPTATYKTGGAVSSLGHPVVYSFIWGDGFTSGWGPPEQWTGWEWKDHTCKYIIRVKARCALHLWAVSALSDPLIITIEPFESFPPETWVINCPDSLIDFNTFAVKWSGSDNVTASNKLLFSSYLDGYESEWRPYSWDGGRGYINLPDGPYTLYVKARDEAGNEDPTPAACTFTVAVSPHRHITVTRPVDGEVLPDSTWQMIEWDYAGAVSAVDIDLYSKGELVMSMSASEFNDGEFEWYVASASFDSSDTLDRLQFKVADWVDPDCFGWSGVFSIQK